MESYYFILFGLFFTPAIPEALLLKKYNCTRKYSVLEEVQLY